MLLPTVFRLLVVAWLVYIAVYDWRTWTVPARLTWPVLLAACAGLAWRGAWAPLALFGIYFLWDTTVGDLKRLVTPHTPVTAQDEKRWLLPTGFVCVLTVGLLLVAQQQGSPAAFFTLSLALVHLLWRLGRLPGGDTGLLLALLGLFPSLSFLVLAAIVVTLVVLPQLLWRYRADWGPLWRTLVTQGPWLAWQLGQQTYQAKAKPAPVAYLFALAGMGALWLL
ncbi:MAG: hypothetical protein NT169_21060 [Chloroflexi bacterium]|nr:hypothetical protein [Chloroflexota bacterium]